MAATMPFQPLTGATTGKTVSVIVNGTAIGALVSTAIAPSILVGNPTANQVFVRMTNETTPVATAADAPVAANSVQLFANPFPLGTTNIAVIAVSVTTSVGSVYFCPGQGGM